MVRRSVRSNGISRRKRIRRSSRSSRREFETLIFGHVESRPHAARLSPRRLGFLGFTSGVTADGDMITIVRFKSQEAAKVDSDLAEQGAWFEETSKAFDGDVIFHDCRDVDVLLDGGSDKAGFVEVMQGRAKDQVKMRAQKGDGERVA